MGPLRYVRPTRRTAPAGREWRAKLRHLEIIHAFTCCTDKQKYYVYGPLVFAGVRCLSHPAMLIKTRLQVQHQNSRYTGTLQALGHILKREGVRGLYRGFGVSSLNLFVGQIYITIFEFVKSLLAKKTQHPYTPDFIHRHISPDRAAPAKSEALRNFVAASTAVCFSQAVSNPIDVVSQKIMVQSGSYTDSTSYKKDRSKKHQTTAETQKIHSPKTGNVASGGGTAAAQCNPRSNQGGAKRAFSTSATEGYRSVTISQVTRDVMKKDGLRGLYRGYIPAVVQSAPSSVLWWTSYSLFRRFGLDMIPQRSKHYLKFKRIVETLSGAAAGSAVAVLCTPLDVIRTRVQVEGTSVRATIRTLIEEEGSRGLMKGCSARLWMLAPNGAIVMTAYELVKRLSLRDDVEERWRRNLQN
eukprot:gb/GECG01001570.1/.p1 GENE.gb/GECG01001570.1/~~gb/GECG01001570.1/.p1  ORF type:complete len:412 (+),score=19.02 gb/GECG01001570.1/:1-1236(+)